MKTFAHELVHVIEHMFDKDRLRETPCECLEKEDFKRLAEFLTGKKGATPFPGLLDIINRLGDAADFLESVFTNEAITDGLDLTREDYEEWHRRQKEQDEIEIPLSL